MSRRVRRKPMPTRSDIFHAELNKAQADIRKFVYADLDKKLKESYDRGFEDGKQARTNEIKKLLGITDPLPHMCPGLMPMMGLYR